MILVPIFGNFIPFILNQTTRVHTQKHTNHTYTYTHTQNKIKSTLQKKEAKLHEVHHVHYKFNCKTSLNKNIVAR